MISFTRIYKSFGETPVVKNLTFSLAQGQTVALLGLSGSGKTTTLKMCCGLLFPDSGEIKVDQLVVTFENLSAVRQKIGYVIQDGGLFPHLTAEENLRLVGREAGWSQDKIRARIHDLAHMSHIESRTLSLYPRSISTGQRQRLGIMRALFLDPPILLLDEPMGALDPITRRDLSDELKKLCQAMRKTVLLVTHDLFEAAHLADHIILLNHGGIVQTGTLNELAENPADEFVRKFVKAHRHPGLPA